MKCYTSISGRVFIITFNNLSREQRYCQITKMLAITLLRMRQTNIFNIWDMKKILFIITIAFMPSLVMAQVAGGTITRPNKTRKASQTTNRKNNPAIRIISEKEKTCELSSGINAIPCINKSKSGEFIIPSAVNGYTVVKIGDFAFQNCDKITSIRIPQTVKSVGRNAFFGCSSLKEIELPSSIKKMEGAFSYCHSLKTVKLPQFIDQLDGFWACNSLEKIVIPSTVKKIHWGTFVGCTNLSVVISRITTPFNIDKEDPFHGISAQAVLYVPIGTSQLYKEAGWNKYFSEIVEHNE